MIAEKEETLLEVRVAADPAMASFTRRYLKEVLTRLAISDETNERLGMIVHELIENICKYTIGDKTSGRLSLHQIGNSGAFVVRSWNRTSSEHVGQIERLLGLRKQALNADQFYQTLMRRTAVQAAGSGLGLGRIMAEGQMDLTSSYSGGILCLTAKSARASNKVVT
jgi:hypothetical protein